MPVRDRELRSLLAQWPVTVATLSYIEDHQNAITGLQPTVASSPRVASFDLPTLTTCGIHSTDAVRLKST